MKHTKDFSIILPTRNNIEGLVKMLDSFVETCHNTDGIEFLIAPDIDDPQLFEIEDWVSDFPVRIYETHRSDNFCRDYFNFLAYKANGRSIWCMNDDVEMLTDGWDTIINERIGNKDLYFVDTYDSTYHHDGSDFPRFPLISKEAVDTLGFIFYPQVRMWPADRVIYKLYKMTGLVIDCKEVKLQHNHISNGDVSKSRLYNIYQEDIKNGVFPVNVYRENMLLLKKMESKKEN